MTPNFFDSVDRMFLTVSVIMALTAILYRFMGRFNKPMVVGGLLAGVIFTNLHLPKEYFDLNSCSNLGDIGIVFFMMLLGARFDYSVIMERKSNLLISLVGVLIPFLSGIWIAPLLYKFNNPVTAVLQLWQFSLFVGLAMSIAALSMVSLFLSHSNLFHRKIAHVALFTASTDDAIFWTIFCSLLVYLQRNEFMRLNEGLVFGAYLLTMIFVFPRLIRFITLRISTYTLMLSFIIIGCFLFAVLADSVNLHPVFGGFIFGMMLPRRNKYIIEIEANLEEFVSVVLLPVFFANLGALANFSLISDLRIVWLGLLATVIAFITKFIGVYGSSRILGYDNKESCFLASLLNIRGAAEVVMLKVGWEIGLISIHVFTILVIMAIATSWIASTSALYFRKFVE